jgi:hypothetical protein
MTKVPEASVRVSIIFRGSAFDEKITRAFGCAELSCVRTTPLTVMVPVLPHVFAIKMQSVKKKSLTLFAQRRTISSSPYREGSKI